MEQNSQNNSKPELWKKKQKFQATIFPSEAGVGKLPPQAIELEEAVLGAIINQSDCLGYVINFFKPEIFYKEEHQCIARAILMLFNAEAPIDLLTVTEQLRKNEDLERVGQAYYVTTLLQKAPPTMNIMYHTLLIYQKFMLRELIRICHNTGKKAFDDLEDPHTLLEEHKSFIDILDVKNDVMPIYTVTDAYDEIFQNIVDIESGAKVNYHPFLPKDLSDKIMLSPGNVITIGGKSGSGKTSLISQIIFSALEESLIDETSNIEVLWYSMEDMPSNLITGYISSKTFLEANQISERGYTLTPEEKVKIADVKKYLDRFKIEFVGNSSYIRNIGTHFSQFIMKRQKTGKPTTFILVIDNLMKLLDQNGRGQQTEKDDAIAAEIGKIYDKHKKHAIIIDAHHFDKKQFVKENLVHGYRPGEENLRGSARLCDISTQIVLVNRPGAHEDLIKEYEGHKLQSYLENSMTVEVTKNRIIGKIGLSRFLAYMNFKYFQDIDD